MQQSSFQTRAETMHVNNVARSHMIWRVLHNSLERRPRARVHAMADGGDEAFRLPVESSKPRASVTGANLQLAKQATLPSFTAPTVHTSIQRSVSVSAAGKEAIAVSPQKQQESVISTAVHHACMWPFSFTTVKPDVATT